MGRSSFDMYGRFVLIWLVSLALVVVMFSGDPVVWSLTRVMARQEQSLMPRRPRITLRHVPGQLIVKYKNLNACAHCLLRSHQPFQSATSDGSASLDALHQRLRVRTIAPMFRSEADEQLLMTGQHRAGSIDRTTLQRDWAQRLAIIQARYPKRTARATGLSPSPDLSQTYLIDIDPTIDVDQAAALYAADPHVAFAQSNKIYFAAAFPTTAPNDTYADSDQNGTWSTRAFGQSYEDLWGVRRIQADQAWRLAQGAGIVVAVIDSGVDVTHEDLSANAVPGFDFVDLSSAELQQLTIQGYQIDPGEDYQVPDTDPADHFGHGTHVAGTIAAAGNNGKGIIGIAPQAKILPLRTGFNLFFPPDANNPQGIWDNVSFSSDIASAINYAVSHGTDVINMSFGGPGADPVMQDALAVAHANGLVLVAAAGNDNADVANTYPAADPNVIAVSALDETNQRAFFSNFGAKIDVAAPGGGSLSSVANILSVRSGQMTSHGIITPSLQVGTRYLRLEGTSMAAPHVAGVAALILSMRPTLTSEDVRQLLRTTADDLGPAGFDIDTGFGRVNALRALTSLGLPGDLDGNSIVSILDLQRMVNVLLGLETDPTVIGRADLDGQGGATVLDLQRLVNILLGLP